MTLNEFFKPTKWKIISALVLDAIITILSANRIMTVACPLMEGYDCSQEMQQAKLALLLFSVVWLIISYLVICVILALTKKIRK